MCTKASFAQIREAISELQQADAVQSEQIKTLFNTTKEQGHHLNALTLRLVWAIIVALFISVAAIIYGALGSHGFNAVMTAMPSVVH